MIDKYELQELFGDFFEGIDASAGVQKLILQAIGGPISTEQGMQRFYIDLDTLLLDNIDLSEAIWSHGVEETYLGNEKEIVYFTDLASWQTLQESVTSQENGKQKWDALTTKFLNSLTKIL